MIDCKITLDKKPDPKGDRVVLSFEYVSRYKCFCIHLSELQWKVLALCEVVKSI